MLIRQILSKHSQPYFLTNSFCSFSKKESFYYHIRNCHHYQQQELKQLPQKLQYFYSISNNNNNKQNKNTESQSQSQFEEILLTGLQSTGTLHLGNYYGSIANILKEQENELYKEKFLFIADLHSLTTAFGLDHDRIALNKDKNIGKDSFEMVKTLLACGVGMRANSSSNPTNKTSIFIQSHVPEHCELSWIFSCISNRYMIDFMTQYKEKARKLESQTKSEREKNESVSVGLYTYPLLMASDILLYKATHVPVGKDQVQHLELVNKLGDRFNKIVDEEFFPKVKYVEAPIAKIMSLTDPEKKMSKSDTNDRSRIFLDDTEKKIEEKLRRAVTDSDGFSISYDPDNRKGLSNLLDLYCTVTGKKCEEVVEFMKREKYGIKEFKHELSKETCKFLKQIQENRNNISDEQAKMAIKEGAEKARYKANINIKKIKKLLRLYPEYS